MVEVRERFEAKVDRTGDCHEWTAYKQRHGYGSFRMDGTMRLAHRAAWILEHGDIPEGMCVCHHCDNPGCVNLEHLYLGTHQDNMNDKMDRRRGNQPVGSEHRLAKLDEDTVHYIRMWRGMGEPVTGIARALGLSPTTVSHAIIGRTWSHV